MENLALSPATQAILDALIELGHGNVHELADRSGKARSTTDKAIKTLADAGLIVPVETDTDPAEGTPTRWTRALRARDSEPQPERVATDSDLSHGDEPVFVEDAEPIDEPDDVRYQDDEDALAEDDSEDPADEQSEDRPVIIPPSRPGDRKVMAIKAVLADYGASGATLDIISQESGLSQTSVARLLLAMEQADAARRIPADKQNRTPERWIAGPTKASEVDPNPAPPRCPHCGQVIRSPRTPNRVTSSGGETTVNADGNAPFGRGELERLTLQYLAERPGLTLTPQEIASGLSTQLGGREISSGAVRNNCTKLGAAGHIDLVSDSPLSFAYPIKSGTNRDELA